MDKHQRRERVKIVNYPLVNGKRQHTHDVLRSIQESYAAHITNNLIRPIRPAYHNDQFVATLKEDHVDIFFNFRTDLGELFTYAVPQRVFHDYNLANPKLLCETLPDCTNRF